MYGKMQESGLLDIIPLICILTILGQCPVFSVSWIPLKVHGWAAAAADGLMESNIHCLRNGRQQFFVHNHEVLPLEIILEILQQLMVAWYLSVKCFWFCFVF